MPAPHCGDVGVPPATVIVTPVAVTVALADIVSVPPPVKVSDVPVAVAIALVEMVTVEPDTTVTNVPVRMFGPVTNIPTATPVTGATVVIELVATVVLPVEAKEKVPLVIERIVVPAGMPAPVIVMPGW